MMGMMMFLADDNDAEKAETEYSLRSDSFAWQPLFTVLDSCSFDNNDDKDKKKT